ncbi:hypothetical protein HMPREF1985_01106 [Mitsuokella sp. oral taxon 131 str. W9106]|nr:hypothetical protein HMPREF1985_01106 [Mitsuokella sp. oral taxon 131 str. W9106]
MQIQSPGRRGQGFLIYAFAQTGLTKQENFPIINRAYRFSVFS